MPHCRMGLRAAFLCVTTCASLATHKTLARHLLPWTKIGEIGCLFRMRLPGCKAGNKEQGQNAMPVERTHISPMSCPESYANQIVPTIFQRLPDPPLP